MLRTLKGRYSYDVIIAGAGPVGLSLGIFLSKSGLKILILEKNERLAKQSRAPTIWPKTQEVFGRMGLSESLQQEAVKITVMKIWDVDNNTFLFKVPFYELHEITPFPFLLILPQSQIEVILLEHLKKQPSAEIRFSCMLTSFTQSETEVSVLCEAPEGEVRFSSKVLAGADGAHSTVRKLLNASLMGKTFPVKAGLADVKVDKDPLISPFLFSSKNGPAIGIQLKKRIWRIILPVISRNNLSLDQQVEEAVTKLFGNCSWEHLWQSEFNLHSRTSSMFSSNRVVLAGDAAHLSSPVAGQGMNAGIQDVEFLGKAISDVVVSGNLEQFVIYNNQRTKDINKGVNRFTAFLTNIMLVYGRGRLIKPFLFTINLLIKVKPLRIRFMRKMTMLS